MNRHIETSQIYRWLLGALFAIAMTFLGISLGAMNNSVEENREQIRCVERENANFNRAISRELGEINAKLEQILFRIEEN
jgi:hypothetical protein